MAFRRKVIIDTDAGIDDAQAIFMALKEEKIEIIAITTCHGNVGVDQVALNVTRVLKVAKRSEIPVYIGCDRAMVATREDSTHYHGLDGLGDSPDHNPPDVSSIQPQHSVTKLLELTKDHTDVTLICLAPLTNIAMAMRMDPTFSSRLKECFIMGGSYKAKGNATVTAEFNFFVDPEAADIVLREMVCPITLACWDLCLKYPFTWKWYQDFVGGSSDKQRFMKKIEQKTVEKYYSTAPQEESDYITADQIIMAVALDKNVVKTVAQATCLVELHGGNTRGQLCVDWSCNKFKHVQKVNIITKLDAEKYTQMLLCALR